MDKSPLVSEIALARGQNPYLAGCLQPERKVSMQRMSGRDYGMVGQLSGSMSVIEDADWLK